MPSKAERIKEAMETPALSAIARMASASSSLKRAESDTERFLFSDPLRASGSLLSLVRGSGSPVVIQQRSVGPWFGPGGEGTLQAWVDGVPRGEAKSPFGR